MDILAANDAHTLRVHNGTLFVHDVVVLQDVLTDPEVPSLDLFLRVLDQIREQLGFKALIILHFAHLIDALHAFAAEPYHEIVLQGDEENGDADIALTAGTSAKLVIDTAGFMPLRADDAQSAGLDDLLLLFVRLFLIRLIELVVAVTDALCFLIVAEIDERSRLFDDLVLYALFTETLLGKIFRVAAQKNIRSAPGHVGRDRDCAEAPCLRHDFRLALMVLGVEDIVFDAVANEKTGNLFRFIDGDRADQNGLTLFVPLDDLTDDRLFLSFHGRKDPVVHIHTADGLVGGDLNDIERIDRAELPFLRLGGTRHTRELFIETEIVLERNGGVGLVFLAHLDALFRLDRLMQAVRVAASDHETTRELVYDHDLAVVDDILLVEMEQVMRLECLLNVMVERSVRDIGNIFHAEESFRLFCAVLRQAHLTVLALDDIIPFKRFCRRDLLRGRGALLSARSLLRLFEIVVKAARQRADKLIHALIQIGRLIPLPGDDERRSGLVDQNGVHLVDDREIEFTLHHELQIVLEIVPEVVKPELVVGAVSDVAGVSRTLLLVVHAGNDHADGEPHELVNFPHPLCVTAGEVIVDRNDMDAFSRKGFQIGGKGRNERFAFARLHLGNTALEQTDAAHDLHMKMLHAEDSSARLSESGERVGKNVFKRFAFFQPLFQNPRLRLQFGICHLLVFGRKRFNRQRRLVELFQAPAAVAAHEIANQTHLSAPFAQHGKNAKVRHCFLTFPFYYYFCEMSKRFLLFFTKIWPCHMLFTRHRPKKERFGALSRKSAKIRHESGFYDSSCMLSSKHASPLYPGPGRAVYRLYPHHLHHSRVRIPSRAHRLAHTHQKTAPRPSAKRRKSAGTRLFPRRAQEKTRPVGIFRTQAH